MDCAAGVGGWEWAAGDGLSGGAEGKAFLVSTTRDAHDDKTDAHVTTRDSV